MDLLKAALYLLFVSVAMNLVIGMLPYAGITPPYSGNITINNPDPDSLVNTWTSGDQPYYDVGIGLGSVWTAINMFIQGVPYMLQSFGAPTWLTEPLYWYYRLLWFCAIGLGVIAARQT